MNNISIQSNFQLLWDKFVNFSINILDKNFLIKDVEKYFINLFEKEEVIERLSLIFHHRNNVINILGDKPKLFFDDWIKYYKANEYVMKRETSLSFNYEKIISETSKKYKKEDIEEIAHNKVSTHTVIDVELWDKAKWKGFGFAFHPLKGIYLVIVFEKIEYGIKIFDKWINKLGEIDKNDLINITIIKGIDKNNPFYYKVMIDKNQEAFKSFSHDEIFKTVYGFRKMNAKSSENLDNLIQGLNHFKKYKLVPASINNREESEPIFNKAIMKTSLVVKDAWEIGLNDFERAVIQKDDNPIIPDEYKDDAPILEVLEELKKLK